MHFHHHVVPVTLDSGAMIHPTAQRLDPHISHTRQRAIQAAGLAGLDTQVEFVPSRDGRCFPVNAMVVSTLNCEFLAGMPFLQENGVIIDASHGCIIFTNSPSIIPFPEPPLQQRYTLPSYALQLNRSCSQVTSWNFHHSTRSRISS